MATVNVTGLTWNTKLLTIDGQKWPFIQLNIAYAPGTQFDDHNTFDFSAIFSSSVEMADYFSGGVASCVFSGKNLSLGNDIYYGTGDVKLHRKVGNYHAGTLLNYNNKDYGFFLDTTPFDMWTNSVNYQFVVYDTLTNKYYVPMTDYMLITRWSNPLSMGVVDMESNPYATIAPGDLNPTGYINVGFKYIQAISELLETAKGKTDDPYENGGGESGTGGGTGTFDGTGDNVDIPALPTLSAADTGFITLFNPSIDNLRELASYMWSNPLFDLNAWKKIFADPMDAILGLSIVPVNVPTDGSGEVKVGNISTGISMPKAATQYVSVDCGTLNVEEYWGAYLDYEPHTKAELYLPYCGIHQISVDDIMGKPVHVVYHIDVLSGACCAYVKCGGSVLYTFIGQCSSSIPITGDNWTNVINGVISASVSVGSMVATGGVSAPTAIPSLASTAVNSMKPSIEKSGAMGGTGGMLAVQTPYLILTRPNQAVPSSQNKFTGYPSFITENLGELSGYTEIEYIHLENIGATENELSEIENLLKGGVIF